MYFQPALVRMREVQPWTILARGASCGLLGLCSLARWFDACSALAVDVASLIGAGE